MKTNLIRVGFIILPAFFLLAILVGPVKAEPYGWSPNVDNSWGGLPTCTDEKPKAPILYQPNHPLLPKAKGAGELRLQWTKVPGGTDYLIYYGLSPKNYIFSVPGTGDTDNYTISHLANRVYYFAVQAKHGCATGDLSQEWAARPGGGGYLTMAAGFVPVRRSVQAADDGTTYVAPTPTTAPEVRGVSEEAEEEPVYEEPTAYQPPPPVEDLPVPTPTPKMGFVQWLLSLIFGKK